MRQELQREDLAETVLQKNTSCKYELHLNRRYRTDCWNDDRWIIIIEQEYNNIKPVNYFVSLLQP